MLTKQAKSNSVAKNPSCPFTTRATNEKQVRIKKMPKIATGSNRLWYSSQAERPASLRVPVPMALIIS